MALPGVFGGSFWGTPSRALPLGFGTSIVVVCSCIFAPTVNSKLTCIKMWFGEHQQLARHKYT